MIKLGERQELEIIKVKDFGVYVGEQQGDSDYVLLPIKQVEKDAKIGDKVDVFIYRDSSDRLIATVNEALIELGQVRKLKVKEVASIGAFLDWGLEKDLFMPFKEQVGKVYEGKECLVALYIDKSQRLCATMKVYEHLSVDHHYQKDDKVSGTVYQINENIGAFVAVDNQFHGLIPMKDVHSLYRLGEEIQARVVKVRDDGKIELNQNEKKQYQMDIDADKIMKLLESYEGVLPFTEKASPDVIARETGMSKAAFKRAIGRLLKGKYISIVNEKIRKC